MKKVLVIGHIWPYHPGAGARLRGLVRYLHEFGWQPIVITKTLPQSVDLGCPIIETPSRNILEPWLKLLGFDPKKGVKEQVNQRMGLKSPTSVKGTVLYFMLRRFREVIDYPDIERGWQPFALQAGIRLMNTEKIDAIISSSPPVVSHLVAKRLQARYKVAWIADFPHLWSQNNSYPYSFLRRLVDKRLELRTLSPANAMVTTSEPFAARLMKLHRDKPVHAITHGFDPNLVNLPPGPVTRKFTITYAGTFDRKLREPSKLLKALQNLIAQKIVDPGDIEIRFYGQKESWLQEQIEHSGLSDIVKQFGPVQNEIAYEKQKESQVLLVLKWEDPREPGVHSLKIFDYLAARRPILAVGSFPDVVDELLEKTKAGFVATTAGDVENTLKELYHQYKAKGEVAFRGDETGINRYSHREMARKFSEILNQLTRDTNDTRVEQ